MASKYIYTLLLIFFTAMAAGCNKCKEEPTPRPQDATNAQHAVETNTLPPATTAGAGTMGCLVNGEVWLAVEETSAGNFKWDINFELTNEGGLNIAGIAEYNEVDGLINLGANEVYDDTYMYPTNQALMGSAWLDHTGSTVCGPYNFDTTYIDRRLEITRLDSEANVLSGLFDLRMIGSSCQDTIYITEGRFDLSGN